MGKEMEVLEHHSNVPANLVDPLSIVSEFDAIYDDAAFLMCLKTVYAPDQRRLP
jgi:hypothetical protein